MSLSNEIQTAIKGFNERVFSDALKIGSDYYYLPRFAGIDKKVLPSLNGLARLTATEGNFLVDDHILGAKHVNDAGFYGTSWMKSTLRSAVGVLSLIHTDVIRVPGSDRLKDDLDSVFALIGLIRNQPMAFVGNNIPRRDDVDGERIAHFSKRMQDALNDLAKLTDANVAALQSYLEDYVDWSVSRLADLTLGNHDEVWRDFGDHIAIEEGTRNLVIVINGVHLRQRPFLDILAA